MKKRSKLSRATSSLARLEGTSPISGKPLRRNNNNNSGSGKGSDILFHSGDSDKENWEPSTRPFSSWRRQHDVRGTGAGVGAGDGVAGYMQTGRFGSAYYDRRVGDLSERDEGGIADGDARHHISQATRTSEPADLDCIQGLLSLSQGAWR